MKDPIRADPNTLNVDPIRTKRRDEKEDPILIMSSKLSVEPTYDTPYMLSELPRRLIARSDIDDPTCIKSNNDNIDEQVEIPYAE
jgi:hypothetical protein